MTIFIFLSNRLSKILGNICKILSYPFHLIFPSKRFIVPSYSKAKLSTSKKTKIPKIIWQTNYSNHVTLPVYLNYLFNRLMSLSFEYHYMSNEDCLQFVKENMNQEVYENYQKINDGAAKADLWRLITIYVKGGVYLDMDANFVWPINRILSSNDDALYIRIKNNTEISNYFLASAPGNSDYKKAIDLIINNIQTNKIEGGVYNMTGPGVLKEVLQNQEISSRSHRQLCIQGSFTNEYFQYLDKPKGKWTHTKQEDILKNDDK